MTIDTIEIRATKNNERMYNTTLLMIVVAIGFLSCNNSADQGNSKVINSEITQIFPKGEKIESENFHGAAWLQWLSVDDSINHIGVGSVTFEPGARTKWHLHPDGQIILALSGIGYYQEQGNPKRILRKGDVVTCPPDLPHWHGASSGETFVQIAITSRLKGPTQWLQAVSEEEYHAGEN